MVTEIIIQHLVSRGEEYADNFYNRTKLFLPFTARLCLLSSFIQDNLATGSYWEEILDMLLSGDSGEFSVGLAIIVCFAAKAVGSIMILQQKRVTLACGILFASMILHLLLPFTNKDISTLLINAAILGSLIILIAESKGEARTMFAELPTLDNNKPKNYLKLSGRFLLILMFMNFISLEASFLLILQDIFGCILMVLVVLGYKTKLTVLVMIVYLNVINFYENNWWAIPLDEEHHRYYIKYKFSQGISVTGGLLMIVLHGPGEISLDEAKKRW